MRKYYIILLVITSLVYVMPSEANSQQIKVKKKVYNTANDTCMLKATYGAYPDSLRTYHSAPYRIYLGQESNGEKRFSFFLIKDLNIPDSSMIVKAYLRLHGFSQNNTTEGLDTLIIGRSLKDVDQSLNYISWMGYGGGNWDSPGADSIGGDISLFGADTLVLANELTDGTIPDTISFDVTGLIKQEWGDQRDTTPWPRKGWIITTPNYTPYSGHWFFGDTSTVYSPQLTVFYTDEYNTDFTATNSAYADSIYLQWQSHPGVEKFELYRSKNDWPSGTRITTTTDTFFYDASPPESLKVIPADTINVSQDSVGKIFLSWYGDFVLESEKFAYYLLTIDTDSPQDTVRLYAEGHMMDTTYYRKAYIDTSSSITGPFGPFKTKSYAVKAKIWSSDTLTTSIGADTVWFRIRWATSTGVLSAWSDTIMGTTPQHFACTTYVKLKKDSSIIDSVSISIIPGDSSRNTYSNGYTVFGNLPEPFYYKFIANHSLYSPDSLTGIKIGRDTSITIYLSPLPGFIAGSVLDTMSNTGIDSVLLTVTPGYYYGYSDADTGYILSGVPTDIGYTLEYSHRFYETKYDTGIAVSMLDTTYVPAIYLTPKDSAYVTINIDLTSAGNEKNLKFGYHPAASLGFDAFLDEEELPPKPHEGVFFDARFTGYSELGDGSLIDIRNTEFEELEFYIDLLREVETDDIIVDWDNSIFDNGKKYTLIELMEGVPGNYVDMLEDSTHTITNDNVNKLKIVVGDYSITTWNMSYAAGWNLVSLGGTLSDNSMAIVFPTVDTTAWKYNGSSYVSEDPLVAGTGYWIKFDSPYSNVMAASSIGKLKMYLNKGWSLIGTTSDSADVTTDLSLAGGGSPLSIYSLENNEYTLVTDYLIQGNAYWINLENADSLTIEPGSGGPAKRARPFYINNVRPDLKIPITIDTDYGTDVIEVNIGDFSDTEMLNRAADLPPVPPDKLIDVRFVYDERYSSDRIFVDSDKPYEARIRINAPESNHSVTLTWNKDRLEPGKYILKDGIGGMLFADVDMGSTGKLEISGKNIDLLKFCYYEESVIPEKYALHPNYPNPFNPVTNIKFSLREAGKVRLVIYNILGQEVRTLLNENRGFGTHTVRWNSKDNFGRAVAGGTYFCRLEVNGMSFTQKLVLIK